MAMTSPGYDTILTEMSSSFTPDAARGVLTLDFTSAQRDRMHQLAEKARRGELNESEKIEVDNYERIGSLLSILQSRARMALREANS